MTSQELYRELRKAGLAMDVSPQGKLRIGPKSRITPKFDGLIRARKNGLLQIVRANRQASPQRKPQEPMTPRELDAVERANAYASKALAPVVNRLPSSVQTALRFAAQILFPQNDIDLGVMLALSVAGGPLGRMAGEALYGIGGTATKALVRLLSSPEGEKMAGEAVGEVAHIAAQRALDEGLEVIVPQIERGVERKAIGEVGKARSLLEGPKIESTPFESVPPEVPAPKSVSITARPSAVPYKPYVHAAGRLAGRTAIPVAGGIAGALASGKSPLAGAATGATAAFSGELLSLLTGMGARGIQRTDIARLNRFLREKFPKMGIPEIKTAADVEHVVTSGRLREAAGEQLARAKSFINANLSRLNAQPRRLPSLMSAMNDPRLTEAFAGTSDWTEPKTFEEIDGVISRLQDLAHSRRTGIQRDTITARHATEMAHAIRGELTDYLEGVHPGLGTQYRNARQSFALASSLQDVYRAAGIKHGKIATNVAQQMVTRSEKAREGERGMLESLQHKMSPEALQQVQRVLLRGGEPTGTDVPLQLRGRTGLHRAGLPTFYFHPSLPAHAGRVPLFHGRSVLSQYLAARPGASIAGLINSRLDLSQEPPIEGAR